MVVLAEAESLITLFVGLELLSIPLYVLCATSCGEDVARGGAQVPGDRIGGLGHAALRPGPDLRRHRRHGLPGIQAALGGKVEVTDPLLLTGIALTVTGLAFKASVAPFHQWTPDVYQGAPTPITAFMAVATKAAAFAIFLRLFDEALGSRSSMGAGAGRAGRGHDRGGQRRRDRAALAQADAGLVERRAGGLPARGSGGGHEARAPGHGLLPRGLPGDEPGRVRRGGRARARVRARRRPRLAREPRSRAALAGVADDDRDAVAGRLPGHRGLHREVLFDRRLGGGRLRLARRDDRDRIGDLARLLPARGGRDVDGHATRSSCPTCRGAA